jgi:hypothetical protein
MAHRARSLLFRGRPERSEAVELIAAIAYIVIREKLPLC